MPQTRRMTNVRLTRHQEFERDVRGRWRIRQEFMRLVVRSDRGAEVLGEFLLVLLESEGLCHWMRRVTDFIAAR